MSMIPPRALFPDWTVEIASHPIVSRRPSAPIGEVTFVRPVGQKLRRPWWRPRVEVQTQKQSHLRRRFTASRTGRMAAGTATLLRRGTTRAVAATLARRARWLRRASGNLQEPATPATLLFHRT